NGGINGIVFFKKRSGSNAAMKKKVKGVNVSDKGKDTLLEVEVESRRQKVPDKRWD
ncbi:2865_t:CDS:2, partial [Gigaspora rosea]